MNGINRRGQKVVCVIECEYESVTGKLYSGRSPVLDEVYTVDGFIGPNSALVVASPDFEDCPGFIELVEIPSPIAKRSGHLGWPIICFRPVQTRETDISDLLKLATPAKQMEPA